MYRCLVWGTGKIFYNNVNLLKAFELLGKISVGAITGNRWKNDIAGYTFISQEELSIIDYDIVIIMSDKKHEIEMEAINLGFNVNQIVTYQMLHIPNVDISKYMELKKSNPTIFAMNCWGGITYHQLGLEFTSPFINMYLKEQDFIQFLNNPQYYMDLHLELKETLHNPKLKIDFPVCKCDNIELYFNHYSSFELALHCWEKRKKRINWDNIVAVMYSEDKGIAERFDQIHVAKKICFTNFESEYKSSYYFDFTSKMEEPLSSIVSKMAWGIYPFYDVIELLQTGCIKRL